MKKIAILLFAGLFFMTACNKGKKTKTLGETIEMLTGKIARTDFMQPPYNRWFQDEYMSYEIDTETLNQLNKDKLNSSSVVIVMATWCPDSQREVPRFYKILDNLGFDPSKITLIAVPKPFKDYDLIKNYNIQRVPTFIFFDENKNEIGRIVEKPKKSLEKDLVEIFK